VAPRPVAPYGRDVPAGGHRRGHGALRELAAGDRLAQCHADDQQAGVNSMLQRLHDALQKIERDESLSRKERLRNSMSLREQTDKDIRSLLNDDQKKKLDQVEREPHPELHG